MPVISVQRRYRIRGRPPWVSFEPRNLDFGSRALNCPHKVRGCAVTRVGPG
jgi:hypothetical protein